MAAHGLVKGTITRMVRRNITKLATGTITKTIAGTTGFTDTIIIIRGTVIPITDLTTNHIITVMVTTLTLGFTSLPMGPGSISDLAFDAAQAVRMMVVQIFTFAGRRLNMAL
jgi:hypothetical protein